MVLTTNMPGWLAVLVRGPKLQCVYVERTGGQPTLRWSRELPIEGDCPTTAMVELRRSLSRRKYRCCTVLPRGTYQTFEVPAPKVDRSEWCDALRWVVKDGLEFPLDEAVIEAIPIPHEGAARGREPMTFVIAARRDIVSEHVQWFQRARLPLQAISIGNMAQRNVAALFESTGRALAFLGVYRRGVALTFTCNGSIYAARHFGWQLPALHDDAEPELRRLQFERVVLDMQRAFDSFDRGFSHVALQRVLVSVPAGHGALVRLLQENLGQTVEVADLREVMDIGPCPEMRDPAVQAEWMLSIGMGLRLEQAG